MFCNLLKLSVLLFVLVGCTSEPVKPKTPEQFEHERKQNQLAWSYFSGKFQIRASSDDDLKLDSLEIKANGKSSQVLYYKAGNAMPFRTDLADCNGDIDGENPHLLCLIEQSGRRPLAIFVDHVKVDTVAKPDKTFVLNPLVVKANEFKIHRVDLQYYRHAFYAANKAS